MQHLRNTKGSLEYEAITAHLNNEIDLHVALDIFCKPTETLVLASRAREAIEGQLRRAWQALIAIASSIEHSSGSSRQQLVDLVLQVAERSTSERTGRDCVIQNARIWEDLPFFGMEMREAWNLAATSSSTLEQQTTWTNLNAWTATLVATTHAQGRASPDFSLYGVWTIRAALEEEEERPSDPALEAVAMWFRYAAACIRELCREGKAFDGKLARGGPLFRDRGWRGFGEARWTVWRDRLWETRQAVSGREIERVVDGAFNAMTAAEQGQ